MNHAAKYGTVVVLVHLVVSILHGMAHSDLHIGLNSLQKLFVLIVITVCPLVAMVLLWTSRRRAGALLLALSMFGALLFGAVNHFLISGPDHVAEVAQGASGSLFQITAVLLAITEAAGAWLGVMWLRRGTGAQR